LGKYGLSIDNLRAVELVTADGAVRIVDNDHEPDLFWAFRGGGGNFGVAASFEFVTHPLDTILGGILAHPLAAAGDVISMYRQFATELSDDAVLAGQWADPADTEVNVQWVRDTFSALEPYTAPRTLVNDAGTDQPDEVVAFYGPNLDRLRDVKRRYDPDNVFHLNQNVLPP
jgi:FAD/FMN-containing dehydrogenase